MGNLVTDAIVSMTQQFGYGEEWASVTLAVWNGGGIRTSIEKSPDGELPMKYVLFFLKHVAETLRLNLTNLVPRVS